MTNDLVVSGGGAVVVADAGALATAGDQAGDGSEAHRASAPPALSEVDVIMDGLVREMQLSPLQVQTFRNWLAKHSPRLKEIQEARVAGEQRSVQEAAKRRAETRLTEIERCMRSAPGSADHTSYWNSSEMQSEYRDLLNQRTGD
jgi:hypothetical protein